MKNKHEEDEPDRAMEQGRTKLESIVTMVAALDRAGDAEDERGVEMAQETIQEDPLSVQVRDGWRSPGDRPRDDGAPEEFEILLCTGGPAVRIVGMLDDQGLPERPVIQVQDWFTPWVPLDYRMSKDESKALQTYCEQFYYGE